MKLRKYLINALETQKRDKAKHKAYIKRLEAQHRAKVFNDQLDQLDLSDEDIG